MLTLLALPDSIVGHLHGLLGSCIYGFCGDPGILCQDREYHTLSLVINRSTDDLLQSRQVARKFGKYPGLHPTIFCEKRLIRRGRRSPSFALYTSLIIQRPFVLGLQLCLSSSARDIQCEVLTSEYAIIADHLCSLKGRVSLRSRFSVHVDRYLPRSVLCDKNSSNLKMSPSPGLSKVGHVKRDLQAYRSSRGGRPPLILSWATKTSPSSQN